jgi:glucosamine-6-phosphate deaminase
MQLQITSDYSTLSRTACDLIQQLVAAKPDASIMVATGNTPIGTYRELAERYRSGGLDTSQLKIYQLDEYLGLAADGECSLYGWMQKVVSHPLEIAPNRVFRLRGDSQDHDAVCREFSAKIEAGGGLDMVILGLGPNGHLGFNEPPSPRDAPTRVVDLTPASMQSNAAYWGSIERVPSRGITAGMDIILAARQILLLVSGNAKHAILMRTLTELPSQELPASWLCDLPQAVIIADKAAHDPVEGK